MDRNVVVVDLGDFENRKAEITAALMDAASRIGFFQIKNHGIPQEEIDAAFAASKRFLELPDEIKGKQKTDKSNAAYILGWSADKMAVGTLRQGFLAGPGNSRMDGLWPEEEDAPGFKDRTLKFMHQNHAVVQRIMSCFALGLGVPENFFEDAMDLKHDDCGTACYLNYYPSVEGLDFDEKVQRIIAHTDFEVLTLLHQVVGQTGLEVCPGMTTTASKANTEGVWTPMDPQEGCITVNIGDALQYWSDDVLKSTYHRVRTPRKGEYKGPRQSMAYFSCCRDSTIIQGPKKKYPPTTFPEILEKTSDFVKNMDTEKMTNEEYVAYQNKAVLGPALQPED